MKLVNLTPHVLVIYDEDGGKEVARVPVAGYAARVNTQAAKIGEIVLDGHEVPVVQTTFGDVVNLPEPKMDTIYVVSIIVAQAVRGQRDDVVAPDTGPTAIRFADGPNKGQIKGVRQFTR